MAETIKTVGSAGADYTSYTAWEADIAADPVNDQTAKGLLAEVVTDTVAISFSNANLVQTKITTDMAHGGLYAAGHRLHNTAGNGNLSVAQAGTTIIERIGLTKTNAGAASAVVNVTSSCGTVIVRRCMIKTTNSSASRCMRITTGTGGANIIVRNCMLADEGAASNDWNICSGGALTFQNCTFLSISGTRDSQVDAFAGTTTITNCSFFKLAAATLTDDVIGSPVADCNSTWATSGFGTNSISKMLATDLLDSVNPPYNLHWASRAVMVEYPGADLSGTFTDDIEGDTRDAGPWYMGADYIAAPPAITQMDATQKHLLHSQLRMR